VSDWFTLDQARIDAFADCTQDRQWIHVDAERAARESPFGGTVAHGFLTLSMIPATCYELLLGRVQAAQAVTTVSTGCASLRRCSRASACATA